MGVVNYSNPVSLEDIDEVENVPTVEVAEVPTEVVTAETDRNVAE